MRRTAASRPTSRPPCGRWLRRLAGLLPFFMTWGWAEATPVRFDLPAQSAATALVSLAQQAGVEVLFSFRDLQRVQCRPLSGRLEPADALEVLLRGTGFRVRQSGPGKFVVTMERPTRAAEVRGRVVARSDGRPIAGAVVQVAGAADAAVTDAAGEFAIREVPLESRVLRVEAEGFVPARVLGLELPRAGAAQLGAIRLASADGPERLEPVVVNARDLGADSVVTLDRYVVAPSRFSLDAERGLVAAALTHEDLVALPQFGEDLYRAISCLPGLAADDMTARFWVRGAPHDRVLARLDGVDLIEPFHLHDTDSSLSILDIDTIGHLDLYTGGFSAEYGNRTTAVLAMETESYRRARPQTTLGASLTGGRIASRGQAANGRVRWLANGRFGFPDLVVAIGGVNSNGKMRPRYHDLMGKLELQLTPDQVLSLHVLHAVDGMYFRDGTGAVLHSSYGSDHAWLRWQADFGGLSSETVVSVRQMDSQRSGSGLMQQVYPLNVRDERELTLYAVRQELVSPLSDRCWVRGGVELSQGEAEYDYHGSHAYPTLRDDQLVTAEVNRAAALDPSGRTWGAYVSSRVRLLDNLVVEAGGRYDANDFAHDADWSPRLSTALQSGPVTWRAAWGVYHQAEGLHEIAVPDGETTFHRSERAEHWILGCERRLRSGIALRLEAYERRTAHPRPHAENVLYSFNALPETGVDRLWLEPLRQRARGVEIIAERRAGGRFTWSASYALARSEETLRGGMTIPRVRDQRHTIYLDVAYRPNSRWEVSAVWQYHTGWPTSELSFWNAPLRDGGTALVNRISGLYTLRLPDYQRLDFRIQRHFQLRQGSLRLYLDVFNALNRRNVVEYRYTVDVAPDHGLSVRRGDGDTLFPIVPSLGVVWEF